MQRKPGYPVANCSIKMPDTMSMVEGPLEDEETPQRRQQLINFGHTQWGFNNWSWAVTKQDLDFVEISNGKYTAGVVAFVSVSVKSLDIHRENIGYATSLGAFKGSAIHNARKCAVTNALRETLLGFGGSVTAELLELLDSHKNEAAAQHQNAETAHENNQNIANKHPEPKTVPKPLKETGTVGCRLKNTVSNPPVAKAHPMPANLLPAAKRPPAAPAALRHPPPAPAPPPPPAPFLRPNSNDVRLEDMSEEEARAERKRRQKQAQEEFRLKQSMKQKDLDENQEGNKNSSLDNLLMAIPSQDIMIEETGNTVAGKRKSPTFDSGGVGKRRSVRSKLHVVEIQ